MSDGNRMTLLSTMFKYIFWTTAFLCLLPTFLNIVSKLYRAYRERSMAFTLDTLYLNWNTTYPAVTVCEIYNGEKNWDISENYFGVDRDHRLDDYVSDITFFTGKCESCFSCEEINCPTDFDELLTTFRMSCKQLISNCSWIEKPFDCCDQFLPLFTEYGICYSFNSVQTEPYDGPRFVNTRQTGPGSLTFMVSEDIQIHVHAPNDIPYMMSEGVIRETVLWGSSKEIIFNVVEIVNDASVVGFPISHRNCRFANEVDNDEHRLYQFYSYSTCVVECVKNAHVMLCQCTNHFMPHKSNDSFYPICDIEGLKCLTDNFDNLKELRKNCECYSSCEEPEYNVIYTSGESIEEEAISTITISMIALPTQRYIRNVVKTTLDLIISVGGISGLFFGISLLSLLEIFYLLTIQMGKLANMRVAARSTQSSAIPTPQGK